MKIYVLDLTDSGSSNIDKELENRNIVKIKTKRRVIEGEVLSITENDVLVRQRDGSIIRIPLKEIVKA